MMHRINPLIRILFIVIVACTGCTGINSNTVQATKNAKQLELDYAIGFRVIEHANYKQVLILNPADTTQLISEFKLYEQSYTGELKENEIRVPCSKIICLSTTQLAYFIELNATDKIVGLNSSQFLFNPKVREQIASKQIKQVGKEGNFYVETVAGMNPDLILVSPFKTGGYDAIKNLGIPLLPIAAYNETLPLGRAEWIKLIALLIGEEQQADSVFNHISDSSEQLKTLAAQVENRPTVFSGKLKSGSWYVPGGQSFIAYLLRDAGADYIFTDNKKGAYPLDFETVYSKAHNVDFWRLQVSNSSEFSAQILAAEDTRYTDFGAYKSGNVMVCNIRKKPYYEENPVKPHVILADFISLFHPTLLPKHNRQFYEPIKQDSN